MSLAFFWIFLLLMLCGLPVMFALLVAPSLSLMIDGQANFFTLLIGRMYKGIDNFPLMAIPFFILAGEMMNAGQITVNLVRLSQALIGHVRGGLAQVNILSSMLFAGLSGSAVADTSALGSMLIPAMERNGYTRRFAAAVTAASSVIGPIIPPSGIMIIYAFIMNVSVAGLFAAGIVPGLMVGFGLMLLTFLSRQGARLPGGEPEGDLARAGRRVPAGVPAAPHPGDPPRGDPERGLHPDRSGRGRGRLRRRSWPSSYFVRSSGRTCPTCCSAPRSRPGSSSSWSGWPSPSPPS